MRRAIFIDAACRRNDVLANVAIIGAGLLTAYTLSAWPDLVVGLGILILNFNAAREVFLAARDERRLAEAGDDD